MSNYPAGVTGWEPQIAGPDSVTEKLEEMVCDEDCGFGGEVLVTQVHYRGEYTAHVEWACPRCGRTHDFEYADEPDYDNYDNEGELWA